jgi:hypothetical protein
LPNQAVCSVAPIYWRSYYSCGNGFSTCFMVVPAFRSFWLSGLSSFSPVIVVSEININIKRGKGPNLLLLSNKSPINFFVLSGKGNNLCNGKQQVQNKNNPRSPLSQTNTQPLPSSLPVYPPYFSLLSTFKLPFCRRIVVNRLNNRDVSPTHMYVYNCSCNIIKILHS